MMKRRRFLFSAAASGAITVWPSYVISASERIISAAVVITDISAKTDVLRLRQVASGLVQRGVGITCVLDIGDEDQPSPELVSAIRTLNGLGGNIDYGLHIRGLSEKSAFFQTRSVYEAKKKLKSVVGAQNVPRHLDTVVTEEVESPREPIGIQASGIHNVLVIPAVDGPVRSEGWVAKVARYSGGQWISPYREVAFHPEVVTGENRQIYYLSADTLTSVSATRLNEWTTVTAETFSLMESRGTAALMSVSDLQLRDNFGHERLLAVMIELDPEDTTEGKEAIVAFQANLAEIGVPSILKAPGSDFWVELASAEHKLTPISVRCEKRSRVRLEAQRVLGPGHNIRLVKAGLKDFGIDECAILRVPFSKFDASGTFVDEFQGSAGLFDQVLLLPPEILGTPVWRRKVLSDLAAIGRDGLSRFVEIDELVQRSLSHGPIETRQRLTRASSARAAGIIRAADRENLMEDARTAWSYIQNNTQSATGLCPATINLQAGGEVHRSVTMWDAGSNINAITSAVDIGLITKAEAKKRLKKILPNITGRRSDDRLLPQGWIRTDRFHWGDRNFDGCDAGRLLAALDHFRRRVGMEKELEKHVSAWEFDKVIVDGQLHSVTDRKLVSTYRSHCAHYLSLAFKRWGYDIASPYSVFADMAPGDAEVALLETVSAIGPLGAEPLLLEAMELGMSAESEYLAEVLLTAQEEEYEETGRLICVSETPINRSPWFIYQGLELGAGPRSWRLDTVGHQPEYMTAEAAEEFLAFSTKAAFLWAAYRPGAYSERLLEFARKKARAQGGFASSVNLRTQEATLRYSDLNTNSIVLQAIAYRLGKKK